MTEFSCLEGGAGFWLLPEFRDVIMKNFKPIVGHNLSPWSLGEETVLPVSPLITPLKTTKNELRKRLQVSLIWAVKCGGHKKKMWNQKPRKLRLLSRTKGEEDKIINHVTGLPR